ncbi:glycosyltransferase family 2 protein [Pedobacter caeni]|uniref:Glycosyltransferase involved in cell wall bisynthesis n=1 Tax=Pedobacter caeni TaxID=288992 RepID=A0A1M5GGL6_9SPHI|nr:glycosyltransferase [Pedobacter caeni]SHG02859.1 Glycosyltransferase involved in cell wall bisynthesis [Pedobacter caeni]
MSTNPEIMVSVCCITYNHEQYIAGALESFLMQETNFEFEILVGEDCSTDATKSVIAEYALRYPGLIRLIAHESNIGAIRNQVDVIRKARGKYIALCDGDDFWIDAGKLQKQVDFLEANPGYVICCHHSKVINENDDIVYIKAQPVSMEFDYQDVLLGKREETRICSLMIRNLDAVKAVGQEPWYFETYGTDTLFKLYALANTGKKIFVMPDVMACYRLHTGGIWSMIDSRLRKRRMISDFNLTIKNFKYSGLMKKELLKIYIRQYFLFDLRNWKISNAMNTIMNLL